ncbi:MAG TPA: NADH-ubiquinone oxidoreductase-F iron-sulfur binding region domain-containing protein [Gammaproteobacteria bacterium]|nr:NADH-ubiquinone oxidoreductase-F iron-sulfur binding region domain-containing protein [Gammaproteobacteria bacterium]
MATAMPTRRRKHRGEQRGRSAEPQALFEIRALLGGDPRRRDLVTEYLHRIQDTYGHLSAAHLTALAHEMKLSTCEVYEVATFYDSFDVVKENENPPPALAVGVCDSVTCEMFGSDSLIDALQQAVGDKVRVRRVPCVGRCAMAPVAVVGRKPVDYADPDKVLQAVELGETEPDIPDYVDYRQYREAGGYKTLLNVVEGFISREQVFKTLEDSNLRGLGGAGFPAGKKWRTVAEQPAPRYAAINIDESEPGTFKDRYFLERDPHRFIEGTLIAAHVIGIKEVYFYLRDEYAACRKILEKELAALKADPPCELPPLYLRRGAGAYICGEESAMIESIQGRRGMPRLRPPFVAINGLWGRPTLEQNLETMHWVRDILEKGPEWFAEGGRHGRKGLRAFSVSGRVKKPGVHRAPAGVTMRELIDEYCGGMLDGHEFYGYLTGGASGGILPASLGDIPLDFDTLQEYGCFIGSAAMIVLSQHDTAKKAALNTMRFFNHESCGKCTPCRVGTAKAVELMAEPHWDQEKLNDLATVMVDASICGLGQAAPNPLMSVMKYFPEELKNGS